MNYKNFIEEKLNIKVNDLIPLQGGMMNESFLVATNDKKYIAYFPPIHVKGMVDRNLELFHLNLCSQNNLTSKNVFFDTDSGIKINEYIEGKSINLVDDFDTKKVAKLLKKFHSLKPLSGIKYAPFDRLKDYEKEALKYQVLSKDYYVMKDLFLSNYDFLNSFDLVISHNDAQRSNIVRSVDDEYFLIDFEFAADNDEYYDIATFGNNNIDEGVKLLYDYLDGNVKDVDLKRYYLWRMYISMQWYLVAISKHHKGEGAIHNFNFLDVAEHFINNALLCYNRLNGLK